MQAEPTELRAEDVLVLTVRIRGAGPLRGVTRPDLRQFRRFAEQFQIEPTTEVDLPKEHTRAYVYRLRPKSEAVKEIPRLAFVYYKPGVLPPSKGYQTAYARPIPLTVKPRGEVQASEVQGTTEVSAAPEDVYQLAPGPGVLRCEEGFALPHPLVLLALALLPPTLCGLTYRLWRRWYPDAARRANARRSQAARQALAALEVIGRQKSSDLAQPATAVVNDYLRQRLDLAVAEPTPAAIVTQLRRAGVPSGAVHEALTFFQASDAARFGPGGQPARQDWPAVASRLILTLEGEPWLPAS